MSQRVPATEKIKGLSKKYCHPEFISASIEHRHAERGCLQPNSASIESRHAELVSASFVKGDPESSSG